MDWISGGLPKEITAFIWPKNGCLNRVEPAQLRYDTKHQFSLKDVCATVVTVKSKDGQ